MPKENIELAIKKVSGKTTENDMGVLIDAYVPHGFAKRVETTTENNNKTVTNVRNYFNNCKATWVPPRCKRFNLTKVVTLKSLLKELIWKK